MKQKQMVSKEKHFSELTKNIRHAGVISRTEERITNELNEIIGK